MERNSQFVLDCSSFTESQMSALNIALSTVGLLSFVISAGIVLLLVLSKAYHSVLQRLFLYLMVATVVRELFISASLELHFDYQADIQRDVCIWIAFFCNWTGIVMIVFTVGILFYLLCLVHRLTKGNAIPQFLLPKHRRIILESTFVILSLTLPLGYSGIPFIDDNYGIAGSWCWIRTMDTNDNCTIVGVRDQVLNGYVFYVTGGAVELILMIVIARIYYKLPSNLDEAKVLLKKTFIMLVFLLFPIIAMVTALSIRMHTAYTGEYRHISLWFVMAVTFPISSMMFPLGYLISFCPIKFLSFQSLKQAIKEWKCCFICCRCGCCKIQNENYQRLPADLSRAATFRKSTRVSAPSYTFYNVSHPDDDSQSGHHPQVSDHNKYDSISQHA